MPYPPQSAPNSIRTLHVLDAGDPVDLLPLRGHEELWLDSTRGLVYEPAHQQAVVPLRPPAFFPPPLLHLIETRSGGALELVQRRYQPLPHRLHNANGVSDDVLHHAEARLANGVVMRDPRLDPLLERVANEYGALPFVPLLQPTHDGEWLQRFEGWASRDAPTHNMYALVRSVLQPSRVNNVNALSIAWGALPGRDTARLERLFACSLRLTHPDVTRAVDEWMKACPAVLPTRVRLDALSTAP